MAQSDEFSRAVAEALASGGIEIERLVAQAEELTEAYAQACRTSEFANHLDREFDGVTTRFAERVRQHVMDQADVLSTFNIVFFGRTGAGKSTLCSAFGQLDGSGVSPGDSDWTTTVQTTDWHGCRLFDTPGINGWGGRRSRDELEAVARRAVEVADVVLLCFDSQSQQASEFAKVADWVRHYGKPTIAVLNIRNLRWRHPAKVPDQVARHNISMPVRQHRDNICSELSNIGLSDTPVVALHSRRALFGRATPPYRGPAERDFLSDREQFGIDYLTQWSNFGVLESLLTALITSGGSQLRLTSLREGMRAIVLDEATNLESLHRRLSERADEIDRAISQYLKALGYLEDAERSRFLHDDRWCGDLLTLAESARGRPYRAGEGAFTRYVRSLLKARLAEAKSNAVRRFKELERRAFEEKLNIDHEVFVKEVFGESEISTALDEVWKDAAAFLERELSLATSELTRGASSSEREAADLAGSAGSGDRLFEKALRSSRTLAGAGLLAFAVANIWNPGGWVAGMILAGVGVATQVAGWLGNKRGADAEKQRAGARSQAAYAGRTAIHNTFDGIERNVTRDARLVVWTEAATAFRGLLREFIVVNRVRDQVKSLLQQFKSSADSIPMTGQIDLLREAQRGLLSDTSPGATCELDRILVGEDWFDHGSAEAADHRDDDAFSSTCSVYRDADYERLHGVLENAFAHPSAERAAEWSERLRAAALDDETLRDALNAACSAERARPVLTVAGDFSAGKSSFIKRLVVEMSGAAPKGLAIRAGPTTDEVTRYELGRLDILDTPGFQSPRAGHDDLALSCIAGASLVIVFLHVNLLIGDTSNLESILKGTDLFPRKWPRVLFMVNRCDELGVDPTNDINEYYTRRERKFAELQAALASRDIAVAADHIHGIAADPFSAVGEHQPVSRVDYQANRSWDGIEPLVQALAAMPDDTVARANTLAGLDRAYENLLRLKSGLQPQLEDFRRQADNHDELIRAITECLEDAEFLKISIEQTLADKISRHTAQAISRIRAVARGDRQKLDAEAVSWLNSDLRSEIEQFMKSTIEEITAWASSHESAIRRQFAEAAFGGTFDLLDASSAQDGDRVGVAKAAGFLTESTQGVAAALGNRNAAYCIGTKVGHVQFKPWGAVKAGHSVARVGVVLQVAAVAIDTVSWVRIEISRSDWERTVSGTITGVEQQAIGRVNELAHGPDGPLTYVSAQCSKIEIERNSCLEARTEAQGEADKLSHRLDVIQKLLDSLDDLGNTSQEAKSQAAREEGSRDAWCSS